MDYKIHTFGCKVNTYDTGLLQKRFLQDKLDLMANRVHVLNTCAVTAEATKEALRTIRRLKVRDPFCKVVVTGCAAQVDTKLFDIPGADLVVGNSHKGQIENLIRQLLNGNLKQKIYQDNIFLKKDLEEGGGVEFEHTRSFLKIQDGCNSFCTYCVIPFARGRSRSISVENLVRRVNELYESGVREAVLTGVHIGDYQDDKNFVLEDLMQALVERTKMPRFRLSSLEPVEISDRMLEIYRSNDRFCPHFHMSIQSANTKVLADMKRKYDSSHVEYALNKIAEIIPNAFVGMDVIVGFPGETEEEFQDTLNRLESLPWTRIHVFPYSERPGTKASEINLPVSPLAIKDRSRRLRVLSAERHLQRALLQVGQTKHILPLKDGFGITRDYWSVNLDDQLDVAPKTEFAGVINNLVHLGGDRFSFRVASHNS